MAKQLGSCGLRPMNFDMFAGLDVDKSSISITFMDHQNMIQHMRIPYNADNLVNYVRRHFAEKKVIFAYEAGPTGYGLHDRLTGQGYPCLVAPPSTIPKVPGRRVKTNRLDSKKIAELLRGGQLKSIHVPSLPYRHLRHLTQLRDVLVRQVQSSKMRIKSLLLFEGIAFPDPEGKWSRRVIGQLRELPCGEAIRFRLDHLLANLEFQQKEVLQTLRQIRRFCRQDPELSRCIQYLISLPGIGWIVASQVLARVGDWRELGNVRQMSAFLGLVPTENSTGETVRRGSITRAGNPRLRSKLIQSAWVAIRRDAELREFFDRIYRRHPADCGARKAIVAVARKLTSRIYAVLHEQRPFVLRRPLAARETSLRERLDASQKLGEEGMPQVSSPRQRSRGFGPKKGRI